MEGKSLILIIDDNDSGRCTLSMILEFIGYNTIGYKDGESVRLSHNS